MNALDIIRSEWAIVCVNCELVQNKQVPWLGTEKKPWQPRNLQKCNKRKQKYNNK